VNQKCAVKELKKNQQGSQMTALLKE